MNQIRCRLHQQCACINGASEKNAPDDASPSSRASTRKLLARLISVWLKSHDHPLKCVASRIGVAESTICQWAHGKRFPSPDNLDGLARCAGVPTLCLLCPHLVRAYEQAVFSRAKDAHP